MQFVPNALELLKATAYPVEVENIFINPNVWLHAPMRSMRLHQTIYAKTVSQLAYGATVEVS